MTKLAQKEIEQFDFNKSLGFCPTNNLKKFILPINQLKEIVKNNEYNFWKTTWPTSSWCLLGNADRLI